MKRKGWKGTSTSSSLAEQDSIVSREYIARLRTLYFTAQMKERLRLKEPVFRRNPRRNEIPK
jgi:hypothetical protein